MSMEVCAWNGTGVKWTTSRGPTFYSYRNTSVGARRLALRAG